ncbi:sensor histidine kinase [Rhodococcus sp. 27YEA15]|uniref:sensor histidine kinase n=1 Tax=Rhodococcus sp. 27YEA15 TaxID=3156259 RepID=UPI003C7CCE92
MSTGATTSTDLGLRGPLSYAIHASFFVLLATSGIRYVAVHGTSGRFGVVLALSVVLGILYGVMAVTSSHGMFLRRLWMWPVLSTWAVLVWMAPSFAWSAFPVLFLCIRLYPSKIAYPMVGLLGLLAGISFYRVTGRAELVTLLGPLCTAALVAAAYGQMERDARERLRLLRQVAEAQSALADTERAAGVAAERERLAREIHDTVTQSLASALLRLEAAEQTWNTTGSPSRPDIEAAAANIRTSLAQSRDLVHDLAPTTSNAGDFEAVVAAATRQFLPTARIRTVGESFIVPPDIAHAIVRVISSATSNIVHHAMADTAGVTITYLDDAISVDIFDDGIGFEPGNSSNHSRDGGYGLRAMRSRVAQLGGAFTVESTPGDGTVIAAQFPIERRSR